MVWYSNGNCGCTYAVTHLKCEGESKITALMAVTRLGVNVSTLYMHVDKVKLPTCSYWSKLVD